MSELIIVSSEEIKTRIKAQDDFINKHSYPDFAPNNGVCWSCKRNIYQNYYFGNRISNGISLKKASNELVTGCPHCNRSYCD